jgi:hypothetical protein
VSGETVALERHTYDDPFLDMAATKLPKSFKKLLELCQIFALTHPQIAPIIWRLAEYAITSLVYKGDAESERQHKDIFEKKLRIMEKMVEWGLDYFGYGNCFISVSFPFVRMYRCQTCRTVYQAREVRYQYIGGRFQGRCRACAGEREFEPVDQYVKDAGGINVFRLEPQLITPKFNRVTGAYFYYYDMPPDIVRSVETGDRDIIDSTPVEYLKCIKLKRKMRLKRVFHFKRPTLSGRDMQWGLPLVMPALKDAYLNQIYKKADEAIALEHSVPLRVIYPQPQTKDPMQMIALGNFKSFMAKNIRYWRHDKNAIITAPMPIGVTSIGGDAAAYSTIQARIKVVDEIIGAMMVTRGFVLGGENWSSASISQRVMENSFSNYLRRLDTCLQWVRDEIAGFLGLPACEVSMKPFKKVDDVQMLQLIVNLAQQKRVSWRETLSRMDLDSRAELQIIEEEAEKYTALLVQELVAQNEASAKALTAQTVAQDEAAGVQEMLALQGARNMGTRAETQGLATKEQVMETAATSQPPPSVQEQAMAARAAKDQALADKHRLSTQVASQFGNPAAPPPEQQPPPQAQEQFVDVNMQQQIQLWAGELLSMPQDQKRQYLAEIHAQSPELAQAVVDVAGEMEQGSLPPPQAGVPAVSPSSNAAAMVESLLAETKSPEDLARRLTMIDARQQSAVLAEIQRRNTQLFIRVMQLLNAERVKSLSPAGAGGGSVVDMKPLPEQGPPRREESPV